MTRGFSTLQWFTRELLGMTGRDLVGYEERAHNVRSATSIGFVFGTLFAIFNMLTPGMMALGQTELTIVVVFLGLASLAIRSARWVRVAEHLVVLSAVCLSFALISLGGVMGTGLFWVGMVPFLGFFLGGQRNGWVYCLLMLLGMTVYFAAIQSRLAWAYQHSAEVATQFVLSFLFYSLVAAAFNRARNRFEEKLQQRVEEKTVAATELLRQVQDLASEARKGYELLHSVQNNAGLGIWELHPSAGIMLWSKTAFDISGLRPVDTQNVPPGFCGRVGTAQFEQLIHPDDLDHYRQRAQANAHSSGAWELAFRIVRAGNEVRYIRTEGVTERDEQGNVKSYGLLRDITERERSEREVRAKERALQESIAAQTASENARAAIAKALEDAHSAREAMARAMGELKQTQAQLVHSEKMASLGLLIANVAHEINTPIGAIQSSAGAIEAALDYTLQQLPALLASLSQTEQRMFQDLLAQALRPREVLGSREERRVMLEAKAQLHALGLATDALTVQQLVDLNVHADLPAIAPLLQHPRSADILQSAHALSQARAGTQHIASAVQRVSRIVYALRSYSRSGQSSERTLADLREGIGTVLTLYERQIKQTAELVTHLGAVPLLHCWPDALNQVWTNLIQNALQAMKTPGTLTVTLAQRAQAIVVSVGDTGTGIAPEVLPRIFDPFFTTKPAGEGSGLGLDIVQQIVHRHGGRIAVQSTPGQGSTFEVILPLSDAGGSSS